jgi:Fibronectin type III-like domain
MSHNKSILKFSGQGWCIRSCWLRFLPSRWQGQRECRVPRPPQELKAFQKVLLQPGETRRVEVELGAEAFRFWHPERKTWVVDSGEFEIRVGSSSQNIRLHGRVKI